MLSRKAIFSFSFLLASVFYAGFWLYVAPHVMPLQRARTPEPLLHRWQVSLVELPPASVRDGTRGDVVPLASRPGSIRDMLAELGVMDTPEFQPETPGMEVPDMDERLAIEPLEREHDIQPGPERLAGVDMRIVEIGTQAARENIDAARRLVRPSPVQLIEEGGLPVLRMPGEDMDAPLRITPHAGGLLAQSLEATADAPAGVELEGTAPGPPPEREEDILPKQVRETVQPALVPEEISLGREPVVAQVRREQEERYVFMDDLLDIHMETFVSPGDPLGYFRLSIRPKPDRAAEPMPKDVTFVIDASKSIARRKLDLTVRGVMDAIDGLRPEDRFNVVVFRDYPVEFRPQRVPASREERAAARAFLTGLQPGGETDIYKALLPVVSQPPRPGVPGIVLVLSDGRPTRGIQDSRGIINAISADNGRNGIYAYAGGRTVNTYLLDMLAYRNRGGAEVAAGIEEIGTGLPVFFRRLSDPLLAEPRADFGRIDESQVFPRQLPDFFGERGVTVYGRYDPQEQRDFTMRLTGRAGAREKEVVFRANLREGRTGDRSIAREWAHAKAYHLIGEISRRGEQPALLEALRELGRLYGVRTPYDE